MKPRTNRNPANNTLPTPVSLSRSITIYLDLCSHRRSWWFWAESVAERGTQSFHSVRCKSWGDFKEGKVDRTAQVVHMGIDCSSE